MLSFYNIQENVNSQGSKGIRQWPINWGTSLMMIHKITTSVDYNKWLKRLDTQLNQPTNQNSIKVPKVVKQTNKKTLLYDFGDSCKKTAQCLLPPWLILEWKSYFFPYYYLHQDKKNFYDGRKLCILEKLYIYSILLTFYF